MVSAETKKWKRVVADIYPSSIWGKKKISTINVDAEIFGGGGGTVTYGK